MTYLALSAVKVTPGIFSLFSLATAELETASPGASPMVSTDGSSKHFHADQDAICRAIQEYRDVLTKNYLIWMLGKGSGSHCVYMVHLWFSVPVLRCENAHCTCLLIYWCTVVLRCTRNRNHVYFLTSRWTYFDSLSCQNILYEGTCIILVHWCSVL